MNQAAYHLLKMTKGNEIFLYEMTENGLVVSPCPIYIETHELCPRSIITRQLIHRSFPLCYLGKYNFLNSEMSVKRLGVK
jgi:hypothetical protein